jgi:hypothetical protein
VVKPLVARAARLTFALDDTPTERYGRRVQGAGVHHRRCPGPAGSPFVYGHVWVVLGLLAGHPSRGAIALPLLDRLYVRERNLGSIDPRHRPAFRTKLELAVDLMRWAVRWLGFLGKPVWVVVDGAYAKAPFPKPMRALGVKRKIPAFSGWTCGGPSWAAEELARLGTADDEVIAQRIGRTAGAVGQKRQALKIKRFRDRRLSGNRREIRAAPTGVTCHHARRGNPTGELCGATPRVVRGARQLGRGAPADGFGGAPAQARARQQSARAGRFTGPGTRRTSPQIGANPEGSLPPSRRTRQTTDPPPHRARLMTGRPALLLGLPASLALALWAASACREEARLRASLDTLAEEANAMDVDRDAILARMALKRVLVNDLVDGRVTLAEATGRFLALNRQHPAYMSAIRGDYPGRTDEESQARNLVANVLTWLDDPNDWPGVRERLGAEFRELFPDPATDADIG